MLLPRYLVQSYEKSSAEQKKLVSFLCRDGVTYLKLRKIESRTKEARFFFMPRWSNLSKVTKNREQNERNLLFFDRSSLLSNHLVLYKKLHHFHQVNEIDVSTLFATIVSKLSHVRKMKRNEVTIRDAMGQTSKDMGANVE